ncbi:SCP2 sterol-binding domain-containing protein [Ectothiorhodospiraceae bacterium WFHF3C12]|nr:SCP2 sterol-binding domain-containing protein [Ectothiorhodospiraceae bacterium WFHF3C12]
MSTESGRPPLPPVSVWPVLLRPVQEAVNRVLSLDPAAGERLRALAGQNLDVHLTGFPTPLRVGFNDTGLNLSTVDEEVPGANATLTAAPSALLTLALSNGQRGGRDLAFKGDVGVIQDVRTLFSELEIDWEEQLSRVLGDVAAHQVGRAARGLGEWLRHAGNTFLDNAGEYLTEEQRSLPTAGEVERFISDVDRLRQDADRLQARLRRLRQSAGGEG